MTFRRSTTLALAAAIAALCLSVYFWHGRQQALARVSGEPPILGSNIPPVADDRTPTLVYAHNLSLRKGPDFRVYIRWVRGQMLRTHPQIPPSFDDPDSFLFEIEKGVIHANIGDLTHYLNTIAPPSAPLKNITLEPVGEQIKLHGTLHKIVPLPIEILCTPSPTSTGSIMFHTTKISVLKMPMKAILGSLHITISDFVPATRIPGIHIVGNDIIFDTERLLPPPHIHGKITAARINPPDIEIIYGNAHDDEEKLSQWHNFLRLTGGTVGFGKLVMHQADLTMIDASDDPWFGLDLVNYQAQLTHGYSRVTPQAGLEIFMPDLDDKAPGNTTGTITLEWLKDRTRSVPKGVPVN